MLCRNLVRWRLSNAILSFTGPSASWSPRFQVRVRQNARSPQGAAAFTTLQSGTAQRRKDVLQTADTIYALSTAPGRAAIAVIRISGPACLDIYGGLCPNRPFPHPRTAGLRRLCDPHADASGRLRVLDNAALVFYFPAPSTATGEDILELHVHGGPAIVRSVLQAIPNCADSRPRRRNAEFSFIRHAEPGEFTKRAFYNGRLDLTQAEALGALLAAETEQQRRLAITGADNGLSKRYKEWRTMLLYARGELEALIDFSEDQHFDESPAEFMASVSKQVMLLKRQIELHIKNASKGELLRNGISIALLGAPNAGKSSLLNRIVGREAAIVSDEEGTTRDIVDVNVDIGGWLCRLGDMAGLRTSPTLGSSVDGRGPVGLVEKEGIRRARERALQSDVVVVLLSIEEMADGTIDIPINIEVLEAVQDCQAADKTVLMAINKADRFSGIARLDAASSLLAKVRTLFPTITSDRHFVLSCVATDSPSSTEPDPGGIQSFLKGLTDAFTDLTTARTGDEAGSLTPSEVQSYWSASLSITHRQSAYLQQCLAHLNDFLEQAQPKTLLPNTVSMHLTDSHEDLVGVIEAEFDIVTAAEHLRYAADCLAKITGKGEGGDVEDVLGVVFEK